MATRPVAYANIRLFTINATGAVGRLLELTPDDTRNCPSDSIGTGFYGAVHFKSSAMQGPRRDAAGRRFGNSLAEGSWGGGAHGFTRELGMSLNTEKDYVAAGSWSAGLVGACDSATAIPTVSAGGRKRYRG